MPLHTASSDCSCPECNRRRHIYQQPTRREHHLGSVLDIHGRAFVASIECPQVVGLGPLVGVLVVLDPVPVAI